MKTLTDLQESFTCRQCGKCCLVGGQLIITRQELLDIANSLEVSPCDPQFMPFDPIGSNGHLFSLRVHSPCFFMNKASNKCSIQAVKPQFCRDYPFELKRKGGCWWSDVIYCVEARENLDQLFNVICRES